jgi:hypothetical protein
MFGRITNPGNDSTTKPTRNRTAAPEGTDEKPFRP